MKDSSKHFENKVKHWKEIENMQMKSNVWNWNKKLLKIRVENPELKWIWYVQSQKVVRRSQAEYFHFHQLSIYI